MASTIIFDGMSLSVLRDMYKHTRSSEVTEYVRNNFGMKGLRSLDLSLAIGLTSAEMENDLDSLIMEISSSNYSDLDTILKLVYDVYTQLDSVNDPRFENLMRLITEVNLDHNMIKEREVLRSFIIMILSFAESEECMVDEASYEIVNALIDNPTLTEDMVFGWLSNFPNLAKEYVSRIRDIRQEQIIKDGSPGYLTNNGVIDFVTILLLLGKYYQYLDEYNVASNKEIDKDNTLAEVISNIIQDIETNEYEDANDNMGYIFEESACSLTIKTHSSYVFIYQLFWSIWLKKHISEVHDFYDLTSEIKDGKIDFYEEVFAWRREIKNGTSLGLLYALYYSDLVSEHREMFKDLDITSDEERFSEALDRAISQNILHESFKTSPEEYIETVAPLLFPGITLFNTKASSLATVTDSSVNEVLDALGV